MTDIPIFTKINEMEEENKALVVRTFTAIQDTSACHLKNALILKKALEENNGHYEEFCSCVQHAFQGRCTGTNIYVQRIADFIAVLTTCCRETKQVNESHLPHTLFSKILTLILKLSSSTNEGLQYWACILIGKILQKLEDLDEQEYENIKEALLKRLRDSKSEVRIQAVMALTYMQDPTNNDDEIISNLCGLLNTEFNARVRLRCLQKIALNKYVLPFVLYRVRDVDANVRLAAFEKLRTVGKYLSVEQKRVVLKCGFCDASEKIKNFVSNVLLEAWLESYNGNYLKLMKALRFDACENDIKVTIHLVELTLKFLFKSAAIEKILAHLSINDDKFIDYENLNWESMLYYRIVVQFLRQFQDFEDHLNNILPELIPFCKYIRGYCDFVKKTDAFNELQYQFMLQQLFLITKGVDLSDPVIRQSLNSLVRHMLLKEDVTVETAQTIMSNLEVTIPNINNRSVFVCEIISGIMYGEEDTDYEEINRREEERKRKISQLQADINSLHDQEKHFALIEKNFVEAQRVKLERDEKESRLLAMQTLPKVQEDVKRKNDFVTMSKCLTLAEALLRSPTITKFNPAIETLNLEVINQGLVHEDDRVKMRALICHGLSCVIDARTARYGIHLFAGLILSTDATEPPILIIAIKAIVDMLIIYGLDLIEKVEEDEENTSDSRREEEKKVFIGGTSLTDLVQALADHLEHEDPEVQSIATRGVCMLLLHNRVTSASLLSRLIVKWANPATEDQHLKQFLGQSLNHVATVPDCDKYFKDAVLATVRTLVNAPKNSALADVNIDNVIKFMVTLCTLPSKADRIQKDLAFGICDQMREKPRLKINLFLSKALVLLKVPIDEDVQGLVAICDGLLDVIKDSQTRRNVIKFVGNLNRNVAKLVPIIEDATE